MKTIQKLNAKNKKIYYVNKSVEELCITHGTLIHVKKNTVLFDEEYLLEKPYVYYLVDGICSISGNSIDGQEQTFAYQLPGEMTGHVPYIMAHDAHAILYSYRRPTVVTKTDCSLYRIPKDYFVEHMKTNLEFSNYLNHLMAHNYSMALAHLKQVQEDPAATVICRFLLQMCLDTPEGPVVPKLFTYNEISRYFGIHEVTVSRIIGQLKREGSLKKIPEGLLIHNESRLQDIIHNPDAFKY